VTDIPPFVCVSGTRTTGRIVPGAKPTICIAVVGAYERWSSTAETVYVFVFMVTPRVMVVPTNGVVLDGDNDKVTPVDTALPRISWV
jgi:hypothetical protein